MASITKSLRYNISPFPGGGGFGSLRFGENYFAQGAAVPYAITNHSNNKTLKYSVKATPSPVTKSLKYDVRLTPSALTKSLEYTIKAAKSVTKSLKYTLKTVPSALTKSLKYTLKTVPSALTKSLEYTVKSVKPAISKSLKYCVLIPGSIVTGFGGGFGSLYFGQNYFAQPDEFLLKIKSSKRVTLRYFVKVTPVALTKQIKYKIQYAKSVTKSITYHVSPILKKSLQYTVRVSPLITKSLQYDLIKQGMSIKKGLIYEINVKGFIDLYIPQNTPYATNDLYIKQNTTFTNLY